MNRILKTYKAEFYSNSSLVVTMFQENKDEFNQISTLLLSNPQMFLEMDKNKHHTIIFDPYRLGIKYDQFISKEEYNSIVSFFEKFRPYEIKYCYGEYLYYVFLLDNSDGDNHGNSVVIYYISPSLNDDRVIRLKAYLNQHGELVNLDSFWYYSVH